MDFPVCVYKASHNIRVQLTVQKIDFDNILVS